MILDDVDHAHVLNPILRQKGIKSMLGVPLLVRTEVIGVLHVGTLTPEVQRATTSSCCNWSRTGWPSPSTARDCTTEPWHSTS